MAYRTEGGRLRRGASNQALYRSTRAVASIRIFSRHIEKKGFYFIEDVIKPDELAKLQVDATNMITRVPVNREAKADAKGRPSINRGREICSLFQNGGLESVIGYIDQKIMQPIFLVNCEPQIRSLGRLQFECDTSLAALSYPTENLGASGSGCPRQPSRQDASYVDKHVAPDK